MQHTLGVGGGQTRAQLTADVDHLLGRQPADAPQQRGQVLAFNQFHRVEDAALGLSDVEDPADRGMRDLSRESNFVENAAFRDGRRDDLQCDRGLEDEVLGAPDIAHPAPSDPRDHPVAARKHLARREHVVGRTPGRFQPHPRRRGIPAATRLPAAGRHPRRRLPPRRRRARPPAGQAPRETRPSRAGVSTTSGAVGKSVLPKTCELRAGFCQRLKTGVGAVPEGEKALVRLARLVDLARERSRAREPEMRQRVQRRRRRPAAMLQDGAELRAGRPAIFQGQVRLSRADRPARTPTPAPNRRV